MQETQVQSLSQEDPLEEGMTILSPGFLLGESPWTEEPGGLQSTESDTTEATEQRRRVKRKEQDLITNTSQGKGHCGLRFPAMKPDGTGMGRKCSGPLASLHLGCPRVPQVGSLRRQLGVWG